MQRPEPIPTSTQRTKTETDGKSHQIFRSFFELDKLAHERRNYVSPVPYLYMFSQNYNSIEKIVSSLGKRMQLTGEEIESDFKALECGGGIERGHTGSDGSQRQTQKRDRSSKRGLYGAG
jgi:hypothetical protein